MKSRIIFLIGGLLILSNTYGQLSWNLRSNAGIVSGVKAVDGYYFSFDIGIPIVKSLQIAPTFSYASMLPSTYVDILLWKIPETSSYSVNYVSPVNGELSGDHIGSVSLLLMFIPTDLGSSEKPRKHELMIGAGLSYNTYTVWNTSFDNPDTDSDLRKIALKSNGTIEPYYFKLSYNYYFKEKLSLGVVASLNGYDGEAVLLAGGQFGVKF